MKEMIMEKSSMNVNIVVKPSDFLLPFKYLEDPWRIS
jgi:hypothetical protein